MERQNGSWVRGRWGPNGAWTTKGINEGWDLISVVHTISFSITAQAIYYTHKYIQWKYAPNIYTTSKISFEESAWVRLTSINQASIEIDSSMNNVGI